MEHGKGSPRSWDPALLMVELNQGHDLTKELKTKLQRDHNQQCWDEIRRLVDCIMATWEKAKSVATAKQSFSSSSYHSSQTLYHRPAVSLSIDEALAAGGLDSPVDSPPNGGSDQPFSDPENRETKKRKRGQDIWTKQVQFSTGSLDSPIEDGHSWRKYGQKDILGAKYPRAYFRCTHKHTKNCLATKHVQRTDDNPSVFDVTYKGRHTCFPHRQQSDSTPPAPAHISDSIATAAAEPAVLKPAAATSGGSLHHLFMNFGSGGLTVKTEDTLDAAVVRDSAAGTPSSPFSAFSFPTTPLSCPAKADANIFSSSSPTPSFAAAAATCSSGGLSSSLFLSPSTSESNYLSMSPYHVPTGGYSMGGGVACTGTGSMHSELAEIISAATSTTSSPLLDLGFTTDFDAADFLDSTIFPWAK